MEYRGKQYSVILTIDGKWKWSAEIEGQYRSGMAVTRPAGSTDVRERLRYP